MIQREAARNQGRPGAPGPEARMSVSTQAGPMSLLSRPHQLANPADTGMLCSPTKFSALGRPPMLPPRLPPPFSWFSFVLP